MVVYKIYATKIDILTQKKNKLKRSSSAWVHLLFRLFRIFFLLLSIINNFTRVMQRLLLLGDEAIAQGALDAGLSGIDRKSVV